MPRPVSSTVSASFDSGLADNVEIILETSGEWTGLNPFEGWRAVREFPRLNGVTRAASVGEVVDTGRVVQLTRNEFVSFSGSDRASLRYPVSNNTIITNLVFAFDLSGGPLNGGQISFRYTNGTTEVIANRPFTGAIQVQYYTAYRLLAYRPATEALYGGRNAAFFSAYGTIISVRNQSSRTLEIVPPEHPDDSLQKELYRVTSVVQVNESGAWEKHPTFDTGGTWGGNAPVDGASIFEYERPHEIGYLVRGTAGRIDYETTTVFQEQGPPSLLFRQALTLKFHGAGEFEGTPWEDAYARADLEAVQNEVTNRFSEYSITVEGV